jgi:hypothetical protein
MAGYTQLSMGMKEEPASSTMQSGALGLPASDAEDGGAVLLPGDDKTAASAPTAAIRAKERITVQNEARELIRIRLTRYDLNKSPQK